ncbi:MAG: endonuclease III [Planctomycetes bacterium]|nr:endonuclease III [Planctomycetota bacterium]
MPRETQTAKSARAQRIYHALQKTIPEAKCALEHHDAYELLMATILSAQCTDERVNMTTPALFKKYPTPIQLAGAKQADVEKIVKSCGFYRNKARNMIAAAKMITDHFGGEVPRTMDELLKLPGVARKTANVVLGNAFDTHVGVVVDTHVKRIAHRMGLTTHTAPEKIEPDLMKLFERDQWTMLSHLLIWHGRRTCQARKPDCEQCVVRNDCPKVGVE